MHLSRLKIAVSLLTAISAIGLAVQTTALAGSSSSLHRLNLGGPAISGTPRWDADKARNPSPYVTASSTRTASTSKPVDVSDPSLPEGLPASLFSTQRNAPSDGSVSMAFPVEPGTYEVRLFFAEISSKSLAVGKRVMSVSLENSTVLNNVDVYSQAGGHRGMMKSFTVSSDEVLNIKVSASKGRPMINGVEIIAMGGTPDPEPEPAPDPEPGPDPQPDPAPDDCVGTDVVPGDDLESLVEAGEVREVFCIDSGTYQVTTLTLRDGQTLDGEGLVHPGTTRGADRPTVSIKGSDHTVIGGGNGLTLKDIEITGPVAATNCDSAPSCGQIISPSTGWRILRSRVHHADAQCIGGAASGLFVEDTELDHCGNRFDGPDNNGFAAAIKSTTGYTIKDSYVHDSNQGIWCDRDCSDNTFVVFNTVVEDNCSFGIHYENTYLDASTPATASITNNIVRGNNWCDLPSKADIGIVSAENATVSGNRFGATPAHPQPGYGFSAFDRGLGSSTGIASNNEMGGDAIRKCEVPYVCK